jgi:hypothetical protein
VYFNQDNGAIDNYICETKEQAEARLAKIFSNYKGEQK